MARCSSALTATDRFPFVDTPWKDDDDDGDDDNDYDEDEDEDESEDNDENEESVKRFPAAGKEYDEEAKEMMKWIWENDPTFTEAK